MSVTTEDIAIIRETWGRFAADLQQAGVDIVKTFLDKHNYYDNFVAFRDHPRETMAENPVFKRHCMAVARALDGAIKTLETPEVMTKYFETLGKNHNSRKIKKEQFENLKTVIIDVLREKIAINDIEELCWKKVLDATMTAIYPYLDA